MSLRAVPAVALCVGCMLNLVPRAAEAVLSCPTSALAMLNFGTVSPLNAATTDITATFTVTCSAIKSDFPSAGTHTLYLCMSYNNGTGGASGGGNRQMANGANNAIYDLYPTGSYGPTHWGDRSGAPAGTVVQSSVSLTRPNPAATVVSATTPTITTYARLSGGQTTLPPSAAPYASILTLKVESFWDVVPANCGAGGTVASTNTQVQTAQVTYQAECKVATISTLAFGASGFLTANVDNQTSVSVTCTSSTPFKVGLDAGLGSGATTSIRKMTRTAAPLSTINYALYRDNARTQNWGNDTTGGTDTQNGTGSGAASNYTIYGRVPPQATPEPGNYQDTVILSVVY